MQSVQEKPKPEVAESGVAEKAIVGVGPPVSTAESVIEKAVEAKEAKPVKAKRDKPVKAAKPVKVSATFEFKKLIFKDPDADLDKLEAQLAKKGLTITRSTNQTVRSDFLHTMRALSELGALRAAWPPKK